MAANSSLSLTSLDFDGLKNNLKSYLKSQSIFADYDYEGSNLNVLLDVLSYNTYMNAFYLNMIAAEGFLDSAQMRSSVVSHAKELNYVPFSAKSAVASVNLSFDTGGTITNNFEIPKGTVFSGRNANGTFSFTTKETNILSSTSNIFTINGLEIYEGNYFNESFPVDYSAENRKFVLSNKNIDTDSISVYVSENNLNTVDLYTQVDTLYDLNTDSKIYFIQGTLNGYYEIVFGDGVSFGYRPKNNATILVTYRITLGDAGNGVANFTLDRNLGAYNGGVAAGTITTVVPSSGGAPEEDIESIRFRAPRHYQTQNRAVTAEDYKTIIFDNFGDIQDINVYGGETVTGSVDFGKVFICIDSKSGAPVSDQIKTDILYLLEKRKVLGIQPVLVNPDYIYIVPYVNVFVNFRNTNLTPAQITTAVKNSIAAFNSSYLKRFDTTFRFSKFEEAIDNTDTSISGNETEIRFYKIATPALQKTESFAVSFNNELVPGTITSTDFLLDDGKVYTLTDYNPNNDTYTKVTTNNRLTIINNTPIIYLKEVTTAVNQNYTQIGVVDYKTGKISIQNLTVIDYLNGAGIQMFATTKHVDITAVQNNVIEIDLGSVSINVQSI